jgi:hypothetical protein
MPVSCSVACQLPSLELALDREISRPVALCACRRCGQVSAAEPQATSAGPWWLLGPFARRPAESDLGRDPGCLNATHAIASCQSEHNDPVNGTGQRAGEDGGSQNCPR